MLSVTKPNNQNAPDYLGNDRDWEAWQMALQSLPRHVDIPICIGDKEVYSDHKKPDYSPIDGQIIATTQQFAAHHYVQDAVTAALAAKPMWSGLPWQHRLAKFRDLEQVLQSRCHEICAALAVECGYTCSECAGEWAEMMDFIRFNIHYYHELNQTQLAEGVAETNELRLRSLKGFTCAVTPFNFPVAIGYHLPTVMALCGNTVVWKPSSDTPLVSWLLMQCLRDAGFPPGVINMITGPGQEILPYLTCHPQLAALNFTGSYATAWQMANMLYAATETRPHIPRLVAETGGKGFMVVDRSADVYDVCDCILAGAFGRSGQKCSANSLVLCHKELAGQLKTILLARLENFKTGNPLERDVAMGPVINQQAFASICDFIQRARHDSNCQIFWGGRGDDSHGFYIRPTCIEVGSFPHELICREIFGPVVAFYNYETMDEVYRLLESVPYRLTGAVWSADEAWLAQQLPKLTEYAGNLYINRKTTGAMVDRQPFGGDMASGTNSKSGSAWYLLNFISQAVVTRRHARTAAKQGIWAWLER